MKMMIRRNAIYGLDAMAGAAVRGCKNARAQILVLLAVFGILVLPQDVLAVDKKIDKRTYTDATGSHYFVVFCARGGSLTGHAFVVWGSEDNRQRMSTQLGYGFYPVNGIGILDFVPGSLQNEAFNPKTLLITDRLIVEVNKELYFRTQQTIGRWMTNNFNLLANNCISFDMDVAGQIPLKVPSRSITNVPSTYLQKLIGAN
jgi:hypothetical protein